MAKKVSKKVGKKKAAKKPKPESKQKDDRPLSTSIRERLLGFADAKKEADRDIEKYKGERSTAKGNLSETETSIHEAASDKSMAAGAMKKKMLSLEEDRKKRLARLSTVEDQLSAAKEKRKGATADLFAFIERLRAGGDADGADLYDQQNEEQSKTPEPNQQAPAAQTEVKPEATTGNGAQTSPDAKLKLADSIPA